MMQFRSYYRLAMMTLFTGCAATLLTAVVFSQSPAPEKPKIKNFGSSLEKLGKKKKKDASTGKKENNETSDEEVIRVKTNLAVSDVLVTDQKGNAVLGLTKKDFVVAEDGVDQQIELFSFGESGGIPRSIVLIIDYSGSQRPFIKNSIDAAKLLVDKLRPQDSMAIVTDDVKILADFTKDKDLLKNKLDESQKKFLSGQFGRSEQYSALVAVLNEMFSREDSNPIVILQSDGDELYALKNGPRNVDAPFSINSQILGVSQKDYSFADVCSVVGKSRATIYSIVPGFRYIGLSEADRVKKMGLIEEQIGPERGGRPKKLSSKQLTVLSTWNLKMQTALSEIAELSGGYIDYLEKPEDAEKAYSTVFKVINDRYLIGYYPLNQEENGKHRNVKITVRRHPEFVISGRQGYFAPEPEK